MIHFTKDCYARYQLQSNELLEMIAEAHQIFGAMQLNHWADTAQDLTQRLSSERFKVLVLGEFKRGKSTFINSLLGREILPAYPTPCTAIINELKWGERPRATLHFKRPLPIRLPQGLPVETLRHLELYRGQEVPALEIAVEELERFVVIPDPAKDQAASIAETPYELVEIHWPLELLKNGVEIIDSPGLNEHGSRTKVTMQYLSRVDAVVFLFTVHSLASQTELAVIDHDLRVSGHEYLFFVCNRFDELRRQADREKVMQYAYDQLSGRTTFGREGVYFVSALDAVIGREENKPDLVSQSQIPKLESALATFLVTDRGRVKLLQPARQLTQGIKTALFDSIPEQRSMLHTNMEELKGRVNQALPKLLEAERRRDAMMEALERNRLRLREAVRDAAEHHWRTVASELPTWASEVELDKKVNVFKVWALETQIEAVARNIVEKVEPNIESSTFAWQSQRLNPLLASHMADFHETAQTSISEFLIDLKNIRDQLAGVAGGLEVPETRIGTVERVLSSVGGLVLGGAGSAIEGATLGYQGMIRSIVPQVLVCAGAILVLHLNPVTIIPALIGMGVFRTFRQGDALTKRIQGQVGEALAKDMVANSSQLAQQIATEAYTRTEDVVQAIRQSLDREVATVREQVQSILHIKEDGAQSVNAALAKIADQERRLQHISTQLDNFIVNLVHPT